MGQRLPIVECAKKQRAEQLGASGSLVMRWTIRQDGKAADVGIAPQSDGLKDTPFAKCLVGVVQGWKFRSHRSPQEPVTFPFKF